MSKMTVTPASSKASSALSRARLSTSVEPSGIAGTSWNSVRWNRPLSGYRTSRLANAFEATTGGSNCSSSAASSSCASSTRGQSPFGYSKFRASERTLSAASRPQHNDANGPGSIRPNSRYGSSLRHSTACSGNNGSLSLGSSAVSSGRPSKSVGCAFSPRSAADQQQTKKVAYRSIGLSSPRATLVDIRQNLRPVKRQIVTDYKPLASSPRSSFAGSSAPLPLFTNRSSARHQLSTSPFSSATPSKCMSPPMSRSSSTVTSPITVTHHRPIPKSERPWRQKLADAQRLREAQADRGFGNGAAPSLESYESQTAARLLAARTARRASAEQQQQMQQRDSELQLEKQIAALKGFISEPGALDKNATVAKFRARMAEGQIAPSLTQPSSNTTTSGNLPSGTGNTDNSANASSLLARMPSLSRRSTTAVSRDSLPTRGALEAKNKDRPLSMVETPFGQRRLSVVQETAMAPLAVEEMMGEEKEGQQKEEEEGKTRKKTKESPKGERKGEGAEQRERQSKEEEREREKEKEANGEQQQKKGRGSGNGTPVTRRKTKEKEQGEVETGGRSTGTANEKHKGVGQNGSPKAGTGGTGRKKAADEEEERGYNAVVQFRPQSMLQRKLSGPADKASKMSSSAKGTRGRLRSAEESKPVPGTWDRSPEERCISQNRQLARKSASGLAVHVHRVVAFARVSSARIRESGGKGKLASVQVKGGKGGASSAVLRMFKSIGGKSSSSSSSAKQQQQQLQRVCAVAVLDKQLANKRRLRLGIQKTWLLKSVPQKLCAQLRCRGAQLTAAAIKLNIVWKEQGKTANVTILLANWDSVVSGRIRELQQQQQQRRRKAAGGQPPIGTGTMAEDKKSPLRRIQQQLDKENRVQTGAGTREVGKEQQPGRRQDKEENVRPQERERERVVLPTAQQRIAQRQQNQRPAPPPVVQVQPPTRSGTGSSLIAAAAGTISAAASALAAVHQQQQQPHSHHHHQQQRQAAPVPAHRTRSEQLLGSATSAGAGGGTGTSTLATAAGKVVLPDQSMLEQYVRNKREALERLRLEQQLEALQQAVEGGPTAGQQQQRFVGAIGRTPALEAVPGHASAPGSKRNSQMLAGGTAVVQAAEVQLPQSLGNSFHAAMEATAAAAQQQVQPQPRLRRPKPELSRATLSTQTFEKPKSLFEEQMQRQAIQLRQKAVRQSLHETSSSNAADEQRMMQQQQQQQGAMAAAGRRRSAAAAENASSLAQAFVSQAQRPHQQEQRYAAHIPLSGRQSTASIESGHSGALDAASRQLDQMLDQARYRHHHHRNKFKEAIDYLDNIFEDFQREAEGAGQHQKQQQLERRKSSREEERIPRAPTAAQQQQQMAAAAEQSQQQQATFRQGSVKSAKEAFEKVAAAIASEKAGAKLKKQNSAPSGPIQQQKTVGAPPVHRRHQPQEEAAAQPLTVNCYPVVGGAQQPSTAAASRVTHNSNNNNNDVDVVETIVLPSKNSADRLDFTRHWLVASGDVRAWAAGDGPPSGRQRKAGGEHGQQGQGRGQVDEEEDRCYDSSDEHSLGSCSAEVAAINRVNFIEQRKTAAAPKIVGLGKAGATGGGEGTKRSTGLGGNGTGRAQQQQRQKQQRNGHGPNGPPPQIAALPGQATIRPQAYRPQPQLGVWQAPGGGGGPAQAQMQKVPSIEHLRLRASQERAGSQDYQSMGSSVHSQEGFRPAATYLSTHSLQRIGLGGAFHSYTPTTAQQQLKGSIQSLPDSALCAAAGLPNNCAVPNYPPAFPYQPSRQFATLARLDHHHQNGGQHHHSHGQQQQHHSQPPPQQRVVPPAVPAHRTVMMAQPGNTAASTAATRNGTAQMNEHALAIDALVAELELNTDALSIAGAADSKRRSFPTMQTEVARASGKTATRAVGNGSSSARGAGTKLDQLVVEMRGGEASRKTSAGGTNSQHNMRPFDTINQEKINPSRVDAMTRMFDKQSSRTSAGANAANPPPTTAANNFTNAGCGGGFNAAAALAVSNYNGHGGWAARRAATIGGNRTTTVAPSVAEYSGIGGSNSRPTATSGTGVVGHLQTAAFPTIESGRQQRQPSNPSCSSSSSAHGGATKMSTINGNNKADIVRSPRIVRTGRVVRTEGPVAVMVMDSRRGDTPTVAEDEQQQLDGEGRAHNGTNGSGMGHRNGRGKGNGQPPLLYDNVQQQNARTGAAKECYSGEDCASLSSQQEAALPPSNKSTGTAGGKIGQLIRKLGGVGNGKPPTSAASMMSLNRVSNDSNQANVQNAAEGMTKSSSLSGEPWRCQILGQQNGRAEEDDKAQHNGGGIGNRLKQTIFGGMVRRRVPS